MNRSRHLLVVGTGSIGERHVRCFQATGRAIVGIVEPNDARRESMEARYQLEHASADLETALNGQVSWNAAVICTPANTHIGIARRLASRKIHLLIEKPLGTDDNGIAELQACVDRRRLSCGVAYVYRHHPALESMRQELLSERWGAPVQIVATCGQHFPTYRPAYRQIYYADRRQGGGAVQDALTHVINAAEWLVGPVERLAADTAHQVLPGVEVEDTVHVLTRHGSVMGCFSLNQHQSPNEVTLTVVCRKGTVRFEFHRHRWRWMVDPDAGWTDESFPLGDRDDLFVRQASEFLDRLDDHRTMRCPLDDAHQTLRVNRAILRSADSACWQVP